MDRQRLMVLAAALACVAPLAGCGAASSSPSSSSSGSSAAQRSSQGSPAPAGGAEVRQAVADCRKIIRRESKLSSAARRKLEGACADAARGDTAAVKKAAREVCEEVIGGSGVPEGAARQAALKACRK